MANKNIITVKDINIRTMSVNGIDYISLTDIAKQKNVTDPNGVIGNWMRNRKTIEYLGLWETLHNPNFNPLEFEGVRKEAVLNAFTLSRNLFKIIEEGSDTFKGRLALSLNLNLKLNLCFADATQVLNAVQCSYQADAATSDNGLTETHIIHAVVHQHLDVMNLNNLIPHIR